MIWALAVIGVIGLAVYLIDRAANRERRWIEMQERRIR